MTRPFIYAIDPGPTISGCVLMGGRRVLDSYECANDRPFAEIADFRPHGVVCEMLECHGMPVGRETFETAYVIGRLMEHCDKLGVPFHRVYRSQVKTHLCRSVRAKDANVRQALIDLYGGSEAIGKKKAPGPLHAVKGHCWQALAVAVTWIDQESTKKMRQET